MINFTGMINFDVRACKCGRIHLIPCEKIEKALESDKELVLICAGCGAATAIGADKQPNIYDGAGYSYIMYSYLWNSDKATVITKDEFKYPESKEIDEILYMPGIRVPMMNGFYATRYSSAAGFSDGRYPELYKIDRPGITAKEVNKFITECDEERTTVNMSRLIQENDEETLKAISTMMFQGLDWTDTPYDNWFLKEDSKTGVFSDK